MVWKTYILAKKDDSRRIGKRNFKNLLNKIIQEQGSADKINSRKLSFTCAHNTQATLELKFPYYFGETWLTIRGENLEADKGLISRYLTQGNLKIAWSNQYEN